MKKRNTTRCHRFPGGSRPVLGPELLERTNILRSPMHLMAGNSLPYLRPTEDSDHSGHVPPLVFFLGFTSFFDCDGFAGPAVVRFPPTRRAGFSRTSGSSGGASPGWFSAFHWLSNRGSTIPPCFTSSAFSSPVPPRRFWGCTAMVRLL